MSNINAIPDIMMFNDNYTVMAARNERLQNLSMIMVNGSPVCKIDYIANVNINSTPYFNVYRRYNNAYDIIVEDYLGEFHLFKDQPLRDIVASILCLPQNEYYTMYVESAMSYGHNAPIYSDHVINAPVGLIQSQYVGVTINLQGVLKDYYAACNQCADILSAANAGNVGYSDDLPPLIPVNAWPATPAENKVVVPEEMPSPIKPNPDVSHFVNLLSEGIKDATSVAKDLNEAFIAAASDDEDDEGFDEFIAEISKIINRPIVKLEVSIPEPAVPIKAASAGKKEMSMRHRDVKKQKRNANPNASASGKKRKREASPADDAVERKFYNLRKRNH